MSKKGHAEFIQWMPYVLDALRILGGTATPREVYDKVAHLAKVPEEQRFTKMKSGTDRYPNQVAWARQYLVWEGMLASPKRGLWSLTDKGKRTELSYEESRKIVSKWIAVYAQKRQVPKPEEAEELPETTESLAIAYSEKILSYLQSLTPSALRHLGMEEVEVTGGSGDKGIDGVGLLRIGPLVTTKIAFQCKRYSGSVAPVEIRGFQGAIGVRAEKGIFFTTGYFTDNAREAARDPLSKLIELIDGERLVELLGEHEFGLASVKTYELDYQFLANYEVVSKPKPAI